MEVEGLLSIVSRAGFYNAKGSSHTLSPTVSRYPYVTGTSVLGITYKDGILLASDTLGAWGHCRRVGRVMDGRCGGGMALAAGCDRVSHPVHSVSRRRCSQTPLERVAA